MSKVFFSHYLETHNFDIVGISETKLKESATNFAFKEQATYKCFWSSNDLEPRGTGVGLLIKKILQNTFKRSLDLMDVYYQLHYFLKESVIFLLYKFIYLVIKEQ